MSNVKTGVGTQDITLGLIWGGHRTRKCVQIFILGWGHRKYYSESGGDTAQENVFRCSYWGGDNAENSKTEGQREGTLHKIKVGCWLAGWFNDYSANPGSILQDSQLS